MKARIITADDLYRYAAGLRNSGVTSEFLAMSEAQTLVRLFGRVNANRLLQNYNAGAEPATWWNKLVDGDPEQGTTFGGVRAILSLVACIGLTSQGRVQTGRVNASHQPVNAKLTTVRDYYETVQSLAGMAEFQVRELVDWLKTEGNNPYGFRVQGTIKQVPYSVDGSGRIPAAWSWFSLGF